MCLPPPAVPSLATAMLDGYRYDSTPAAPVEAVTNCRNCGAPTQPDAALCAYCASAA